MSGPTKRAWFRASPWWIGPLSLLVAMTACSSSPRPTAADLPYATASSAQRLNLYVPPGKGPFPVVIMIHGGAFLFGGPDDVGPAFAEDVAALNADGIAVASVGYRLSGEATFPAAVRDVKAAIRFLRVHADANRLDPGRFALWGKSAGANLALLAGIAHRQSLFDNPSLAPVGIDDRVRAIVAFYPPVDFGSMDDQLARRGCKPGSGPFAGPHSPVDSPESRYLGAALATVPDRVAASNPARYVTADAPPVYITAGTADCTIPADQSQLMFDTLRAKAPASGAQLFLVPGAIHADAVFDQGDSLKRVRAFLKANLR